MQACRDLLRQHMNQSRRDIDEIKERISTLEQVLQDDIRARDHAQHEETIHQIAERRRSMLPQTQQQQSLGENLSLYPICITVILNLRHQLRQAIGHMLTVVTVVRQMRRYCMLLSCLMFRHKDLTGHRGNISLWRKICLQPCPS